MLCNKLEKKVAQSYNPSRRATKERKFETEERKQRQGVAGLGYTTLKREDRGSRERRISDQGSSFRFSNEKERFLMLQNKVNQSIK